MNKFFRYALLVLLLGAVPLSAQSPSQVKTVELKQVGPQAISEPLIRANIRVKQGDTFSRLTVDDDVRNLYKTGYFYNIRIVEDPTPDGVVLTYVLVAKPRLTEIRFTGNTKYANSQLLKVAKSKVGEPLDEPKLFADAQEIKKKYQNAGFPGTGVEYKVNPDENAGRATVVFEIVEAPKIKLVDVLFDGAVAYPQKQLRKEIKTRRWWMFSWITQSGKIKDDVLAEDKEKLSEFYRNHGYIDYELKEVRQESVSANKAILHFVVSEGRQYRLGAVSFKGATLFETNRLSQALKMNVGNIFTPKGLATDREALEDLYGTKGHIDVRIFARKLPNIETGTMDLAYEITEGEKSYIEKIEIKGNVKTKDKVIRRELAVSPGEVFDMVRVKRSKARLQQMGFFERVDTRPEDTDVPNRKNLVVGVEEKNTGNFTIGAGFSSVDSLVGFAEVSQSNFDLFNPPTFTGAGQKLRLRASVGTVRKDYLLAFVEPWFLDRKLSLGVDLYYREYSYYSTFFDERRYGGKVGLTRTLGSDFLIGATSITLEDVGIFDVDPDSPITYVDTEGDYFMARLGASIAYDTRNNVLLPNRGQRSELVGEVVGGDANFYKLEAKTSWFFPGFGEGHVFEVGVKAGVIDAFSEFGQDSGPVRPWNTTNIYTGNVVTHYVKNQPHNNVPFFERYFLGGAYSLRGFKYREVSPMESGIGGVGLEPVGGNTYWMAYAEYSLPIIDRLRVAAFYDMGNVYYDSYQWDFAEFNADIGMGVRINLPVGPLRFDYAYPVKNVTGQGGGGRFNFTVGYQREF
jgi:outer membrane protein insertion porin family